MSRIKSIYSNNYRLTLLSTGLIKSVVSPLLFRCDFLDCLWPVRHRPTQFVSDQDIFPRSLRLHEKIQTIKCFFFLGGGYLRLSAKSWMFCERPNEIGLSSSSLYAPLSLDCTCLCSLIFAPPPDFRWLSHTNLQDFHHNCCTNAAFSLQSDINSWSSESALQ